ncbi:MAG: hypothetical protein KA586_05115 [Candidatus Promineofilum sp.]|nr:hypothetical protein [Promineifilum sp.]
MMRRLSALTILLTALFAAAQPALAQEENPLAHAVLFDNVTGWALVGLAALLMLLFILRTRRGPN